MSGQGKKKKKKNSDLMTTSPLLPTQNLHIGTSFPQSSKPEQLKPKTSSSFISCMEVMGRLPVSM